VSAYEEMKINESKNLPITLKTNPIEKQYLQNISQLNMPNVDKNIKWLPVSKP
jgi:hypothetical protein